MIKLLFKSVMSKYMWKVEMEEKSIDHRYMTVSTAGIIS